MWIFLSKLVWEHFPTNSDYFNYSPRLLFMTRSGLTQCGFGYCVTFRVQTIFANVQTIFANTCYAVKYHFFLGIVSVWWLLKPSTPPIPHKSTDSNLMCGLVSIVGLMYHHTETIPKRFHTTPNGNIFQTRTVNTHLCSKRVENSLLTHEKWEYT